MYVLRPKESITSFAQVAFASSGNTVVKYSPPYPMIKGSSTVIGAGTGR
jgi:hypothetical protein